MGVTDDKANRNTPAMSTNPLMDNLSRLMTDAMGVAQGVKKEADGVFRAKEERLLRDNDVVTREENDRLAARIEALEAALKIAAEK